MKISFTEQTNELNENDTSSRSEYTLIHKFCNQLHTIVSAKPCVVGTWNFAWLLFILMFLSLQKHFILSFIEKKLWVMEFEHDSLMFRFLGQKSRTQKLAPSQCQKTTTIIPNFTINHYYGPININLT